METVSIRQFKMHFILYEANEKKQNHVIIAGLND